jgi:hypothetical protein
MDVAIFAYITEAAVLYNVLAPRTLVQQGWRRSLLAQEEKEDVPGEAIERNSQL